MPTVNLLSGAQESEMLLLLGRSRRVFVLFALLFPLAVFAQSTQWTPVGPEGGDVRSLAYDPQNPDRILL